MGLLVHTGGIGPIARSLSGLLIFALILVSGMSHALAQDSKSMPAGKPFTFAAIGDMPYETPGAPVQFDRLIKFVNQAKPEFTIHTGDIISGRTRCSQANYMHVKKRFDLFDTALIYTPGDNEWTDCHRMFGGEYDPIGRLAIIRQMFFANPAMSLGRKPVKLTIQPDIMPQYKDYVENRRFLKSGVIFTTVHIVGSKNNMRQDSPAAMAEYLARDRANLAWIGASFDLAIRQKAPAMVFAWQANLHATPRFNRGAPYSIAFTKTIDAVERGAKLFRKPVLVIAGDFHIFDVSPFLNSRKEPIANVTRLQVFGDDKVHATLVNVDPAGQNIFTIKPLLVPGNAP